MRIYPRYGVWEERFMPKDQSFEDAAEFLAASAFFGRIGNAEGAEKDRTKRTSPQRWSSVNRFLNEGMGFLPSLI